MAHIEPAGTCGHCGKQIERHSGPGFVIYDHPTEGRHTVCDFVPGMAPTNRVATPESTSVTVHFVDDVEEGEAREYQALQEPDGWWTVWSELGVVEWRYETSELVFTEQGRAPASEA